jgi:signal transduction histidine kinase/DNA-binding response OmpR family regulator
MEKFSDIYDEYIRDLTVSRVKFFLMLGMIIIPIIGTIDFVTNPSRQYFHALRFGISFIFGFILFLFFKSGRTARKNIFLLGYLSSLLPAMMIGSYILSPDGNMSSYDGGFYLILLAFCLIMPWSLKRSIGVYLSIYLVFLLPGLANRSAANFLVFLQHHLFMISAVIIASTASYFHEQLRFKEFKSSFDLKESRKEMESAKNEIEKAYRDLKEADQIKTDFFTNVNHELRTPLTLILLPLEMALNKEYGELSPLLQKSMSTVRTNALRLLNLINGLLDLAKTDAGKMELYRKRHDLKLIVQGIISSLSLIADRKNIRLIFLSETSIPEFYFDREKIERTFINLISNALKFTDPEGNIEVRLEVKEGFLEARVKDTGIGIPPTAFEKVFKRFVQIDSSSSRKYQGTGLGLTLCKEFVELHGGEIRVESELGEGSTFIFTLPLLMQLPEEGDPIERRSREMETNIKRRSEDLTKNLSISALYESIDLTKPMEIYESSESENDSLEKYQVLVVEEHAQMREYIRLTLQKEYRVLTAQNGVDALEKIRKFLPDLVISDLMMPQKDGYQLCQEMRESKEMRQIPVILLTAKAEISSKMKALKEGATEYLSKPFHSEELLARVRSLFRLMELEKENLQSKRMAAMVLMISGVIHEINSQDSTLEMVQNGIDRIGEIINHFKAANDPRSLRLKTLPDCEK